MEIHGRSIQQAEHHPSSARLARLFGLKNQGPEGDIHKRPHSTTNLTSHVHASYETQPLHMEGFAESDDENPSEDYSNSTDSVSSVGEPRQTLGVLPLAAIIFYSVSGGPFGVEETVRSAGAFYSLVGFAIAPFIFSLPECLMTAELSSAWPSSAAGVCWSEEAFGPLAGWMTGFLNWIAGTTDNAIYPVLFLDYLLEILPNVDVGTMSLLGRFCLTASMSLLLAYFNWRGLKGVGDLSIGLCLISMSPFLIFILVGAFQVDPSRWFERPSITVAEAAEGTDDVEGGLFPNAILEGVLLRPFVNNLWWNMNSFDNAGSFSDCIHDRASGMPRAMMLSFAMVALGYFLPLLVALGASDASQEDWVDGYLGAVVTTTCGPFLGAWMLVAAAISNVGQFQAELSADSFQLMGMAERGHLPKFLSTRSPHGTPTYAIAFGTIIIALLGVSNLDQLIEMLNFNYALSLLMEYCAFIKLRISKPDVTRPFRVPLGTTGCILLIMPAVLGILLLIVLASYSTIGVSVLANAVGITFYFVYQRRDKR